MNRIAKAEETGKLLAEVFGQSTCNMDPEDAYLVGWEARGHWEKSTAEYDAHELADFISKARKIIRQGATEADFQAADRALHILEGRTKI